MASETATNHGEIDGARFGRAIGLGIFAGIPIAIIAVTIGLWMATDADLTKAFATGIWPGILTGVFIGGFVGVIVGGE